ncbi:MAG: winged helix-turn-helix transcriptional regulator [Lactococcus lactis]|nr:winged helix-turn-helix transcriptional regulator [Lactococcus lactis]
MPQLKKSLIELQCEMVAERAYVNPKDISWLQYDILIQLEKHKHILPSNLSIVLGISRTKLSKALKSLKSLGYIKQLPNQLDGRELYTSITSDGQNLLTSIESRHTILYEVANMSLSKQEQKEFACLANKLSSALRKERVTAHE